MDKPTVAFICVHNACRSQIAEAIARSIAADALVACSAGTDPAASINEDAVQALRNDLGIDATGQRPKRLEALPAIDIVITMGCGVRCPALPASQREDWGLEDPTGKDGAAFERTVRDIENRVLDLRARILAGEFDPARLASNLRALGDVNRLRIVEMLRRHDELCACRLLEELEISQSTLSHHMAVLCDTGLVRARRDGRWMRYRLDELVLPELARLLERGTPR